MGGSTNTSDSRRRMLPLERLVAESCVAGDTTSLQNRWADFVGNFGAEAYWIVPFSPQVFKQPRLSMPRITIAHNVPSGWHEHYRQQGFLRHDPVIKKGLAGGSIFTGAQAIDEFGSPEATRILAEAKDFGLPDARGHVLMSLGFAPEIMLWTTLCLPSTDIHLDATTRLVLKTALFLFYARHQELKPAVPLVAEAPHLTPRERDVLHWIALGKNKEEIAERLGVSTSCVKRHCENASLKLGANNMASAVARAMSHGLIAV